MCVYGIYIRKKKQKKVETTEMKKKKENGADQQLVKDDGLKTRQTTLDTHEPTQF